MTTRLPRIPKWLSFCSTALLTVSPAFPQDTQTDEDEIYSLSPFEVRASEDTGYTATQTLAASRIKTQLRDVASTIQVVTKEVLDDTASTDAEDLLVYTTGTEVSGTGGNYSAASDAGDRFDFRSLVSTARSQTRVRGLAAADLTRSFFLTDIPFDTYNVDRVTINRGANSSLFGLGSPAGIINYGLSKAIIGANSGEVGLSYGKWGSTRATLNVNRSLDDTLAIRIAGLYEDEKFEQDSAFERDERFYGAVRWSPLPSTTFNATVESGSIDANRPYINPPDDGLSHWWTFGRPTNDPAVDSYASLFGTAIGTAGDMIFTPTIPFDSPTATESGTGFPGLVNGGDYQAQNGELPGFVSMRLFNSIASGPRGNDISGLGAVGSFYKDTQIVDETIFDYRNQKLDGNLSWQRASFEAYNVSFSQLFLEESAGIELSFDTQEIGETNYSFLGARRSQAVYIDINEKLPNLQPNPNFGRAFATGQSEASEELRTRDAIRATAFIEHDFARESNGIGKWLGRHVLTGLYSEQSIESKDFNYGGNFLSASIDAFPNYLATQAGNNRSRRGVVSLHYLSDDLMGMSSPVGAGISSIRAIQMPQATETITLLNRDTQTWDVFQQDIIRYQDAKNQLVQNAQANKAEVDSFALILQSYLIDDLLSVQTSWRQDDVRQFSGTTSETTALGFRVPSSLALGSSPDLEIEDEIFSWGAVLHSPTYVKERLPWGLNLSLHYSESENFRPASSRVGLYGDELAPPTGETQEMGFSIEALEGKFFIRANWYETTQANETASLGGVISSLRSLESRFVEELPGLVEAGYLTQARADQYQLPSQRFLDAIGWTVTQSNGVVDVQTTGRLQSATTDFVAEGFELEMAARPTRHWSFIFNAAQQETVKDNTGALIGPYIEERLPVWSQYDDVPFQVADPSFSLARRATRDIINPYNTVKLQDGLLAQELREWRWNVITNYDFTEGRLAGLSLGGAIRWQDSAAIGYPVIYNDELESYVSDVANPYFGPSEERIDLFTKYERELRDRVLWSVQLNLRNAFGGDGDLIPVGAQPDGSIAAYRIGEPLTWELSTRLRF